MFSGYFSFAVFSGCAAVTAYLVPRRARYIWLLLCGFAFFIWAHMGMPAPFGGNWVTWGALAMQALPAFLLALGMALLAWVLAMGQHLCKNRPGRLALLCLGLGCSLGLWAAGKPLGLLTAPAPPAGLSLPFGLGVYTLQAAGYAVDVYTRRAPAEKNPVRYLAFAFLFPAMGFGPIQRAPGVLPQLRRPERFCYNRLFGGVFRLLWGVFKKMLIADNLAVFTGWAMREPTVQPAPVLAACLVLFAVQLYCELSGYADMALGAGSMLGLELCENFTGPFTARNFAGLWSRWMASVLGVFGDILALPLEALKKRVPALCRPLARALGAAVCFFAAFMLFGLWHGAGFAYLGWAAATGALAGLSLAARPHCARLAHAVPFFRARAVRLVLGRILVWMLFLGSMLLFMCVWFGRPLGGWWWRFASGWGSLNPDFLLGRLALSGLALPRMQAALAGACLVLGIDHFAARKGGAVTGWIRRRRFFIRWPLTILLVLAIVFYGVFPGLPGMLHSF